MKKIMKLLSCVNNEVTEHKNDLSNENNKNVPSGLHKHTALFQIFGIDVSPLNPKKKRRCVVFTTKCLMRMVWVIYL